MFKTFTNRAVQGVLAIAAGAGLIASGLTSPAEGADSDLVQAPAGGAASNHGSDSCPESLPQAPGSSAKHTVSSGGLEREYILTIPAEYQTRSDWPLIIAFHGRGSTGVEVEGYSRLSDLPAVVAYPFGEIPDGDDPRRAWQGAPYSDPDVDDVAFAVDLIEALNDELCIDDERVYATGKSNGGGLALALACRIPDRIAAAAAAAPALYPETREGCLQKPTAPTMIIHGTDDVTIPYAGDPARDLPAIEKWGEELAAASRCRSKPKVTHIGEDVQDMTWSKCAHGGEVAVVSVEGGGHVWPGAAAYSGGGHTTHTISGNDVVWEFFTAQR